MSDPSEEAKARTAATHSSLHWSKGCGRFYTEPRAKAEQAAEQAAVQVAVGGSSPRPPGQRRRRLRRGRWGTGEAANPAKRCRGWIQPSVTTAKRAVLRCCKQPWQGKQLRQVKAPRVCSFPFSTTPFFAFLVLEYLIQAGTNQHFSHFLFSSGVSSLISIIVSMPAYSVCPRRRGHHG